MSDEESDLESGSSRASGVHECAYFAMHAHLTMQAVVLISCLPDQIAENAGGQMHCAVATAANLICNQSR